jgi:hypothetical protein
MIEYEIIAVSKNEFKVKKYNHGFEEQEYTVSNKQDKGFKCSCIAGHIHKSCKHNKWVRAIRNNKVSILPSNVKLLKQLDGEKARKDILNSLMRMKGAKKDGAKKERSETIGKRS